MSTFQAILLAIVEGLTEYLPISSTGHLILTSAFMGMNEVDFVKDFTVIVQFGAILSVVVLYWRRFVTSISIYLKLFVAFLPVAIVGLLLKNKIDALLGNVEVVAVAMVVGGVALLFVDRWFAKQEAELAKTPEAGDIDQLGYKESALIGLIQCLALVPGISRSAATIIGGVSQRLTRKAAAEFSFLLAVPVLTAATGLKVLKIYKTIEPSQISNLVIGNVVSFIVGAITIKLFVTYLSKHGFFYFGVYRIVVGGLLLIWIFSGHSLAVL